MKEGTNMLTDLHMYATLPATDLERARSFYAEKLGLTPERELPGGLLYRCGRDSRFSLFTSQGEASGTHTQAMWLVEDVESEVAALKARGVVFEEYDSPSLKTINSIATIGPNKGAWFKDSEGNLLSLAQFEEA
jgi:catechol 2,3-dioxygenase-like lactoylglutathione lyase family enzyme